MTKICNKCKENKSIVLFEKRTKDSFRNNCQECRNKINRAQGTGKKLRLTSYKNSLRKKYDLSINDYEKMYNFQEGKCLICKENFPSNLKEKWGMAVDHCHTTGKVRGLLCRFCNQALGSFRDNIVLLENAIEYLKNSSNGS